MWGGGGLNLGQSELVAVKPTGMDGGSGGGSILIKM